MTGQPKGKRRAQADDPEQSARFIEAARKLGIEEVGKDYERALERILAAPTPTSPVSGRRPNRSRRKEPGVGRNTAPRRK